MISELEAMTEQRGLLASLRRSHADLVAVVAAVLTVVHRPKRSRTGRFMGTPRTVVRAGTPSVILDTAGVGTQPSVTTRDLFGVVRAKDTFGVLIWLMAGISARLMECCRCGIECGQLLATSSFVMQMSRAWSR
jgi:hypothetical protein